MDTLSDNRLKQSVGSSVTNSTGEILGQVMELTRDATDEGFEYLILKSKVCFGRGSRFFAIPTASDLIKISRTGEVILWATKDDLQFAKGVLADECPKPNMNFGKTIYELYGYEKILK